MGPYDLGRRRTRERQLLRSGWRKGPQPRGIRDATARAERRVGHACLRRRTGSGKPHGSTGSDGSAGPRVLGRAQSSAAQGRIRGWPSSTRGRSRMDERPCPDLCGGVRSTAHSYRNVCQANWQKTGGESPLERRSNQTAFLREPCVGSREGAGEASAAARMGGTKVSTHPPPTDDEDRPASCQPEHAPPVIGRERVKGTRENAGSEPVRKNDSSSVGGE